MKARCKANSKQAGLFTAVRWPKAQAPRREEVLALLGKVVQWAEIESAVRPHYMADARKTGRRGYALPMLARVFAMQQLWAMSDRQTEAAILDSHAMCKFIGTDPWQPRPPSDSAIRSFRALLERAPCPMSLDTLGDWIAQKIRTDLRAAGLEFRPGRIEEPVFRRLPGAASADRQADSSPS